MTSRSNIITLILLTILAVTPFISGITVNCGDRQEAVQGQHHAIVATGLASGKVTVRFVGRGDSDSNPRTVGTCEDNGVCIPTMPNTYQLNRSGQRCEVRVLQVERDGRTVLGEWRFQQSQSESCTVRQVIWPPEIYGDRCTVTFDEYDKTVKAICHIFKVFPAASCQWFIKRDGATGTELPVPSAHTKTEKREFSLEGGDVFYDTKCRIDMLPLPQPVGVYEVLVRISPGNAMPSVVFNSTNEIARPNPPVLSDDCRLDYIDFDNTAADEPICTFETSSMGSPTGLLELRNPDGGLLSTSKSPTITLLLNQVGKTFNNREFRSTVQHHTGAVSVSYTPRLAYGPANAYVSDVTSTDEKERNIFRFKCTVDDVQPMPEIEWQGADSIIEKEDTRQDGSYFISFIKFQASPGTQITCIAKNTEKNNYNVSSMCTVVESGIGAGCRSPEITGKGTYIKAQTAAVVFFVLAAYSLR